MADSGNAGATSEGLSDSTFNYLFHCLAAQSDALEVFSP